MSAENIEINGITRRDVFKGLILLGATAMAVSSPIVGVELSRRTNAGPTEWAKSLIARRGSYEMYRGESLIIFPDAIVTGDVNVYMADSPIPLPMDLLDAIPDFPNLGNLLVVNSQVRIHAPHGAFAEYNPGTTEDKFLASKLEQMSKPVNCVNGCDGIIVWRFSEVNGTQTLSAEGVYLTKEQKFIPTPKTPTEEPVIKPPKISSQTI